MPPRRLLAIVLWTASVFAPQAVFAADDASTTDQVDEKKMAAFGPLTLDILLAGGISSELYVHAEPALELGILRVGDTGAVSVGAGIDIGVCALCGLVTALSDLDWKGRFYAPFGRASLHAGRLGGLIPYRMEKSTLDVYLGVLAGPSFYSFSVGSAEAGRVEFERFTIRVAPLLGARLGFADNHLLLFGEYRFNVEGGFSSVTYTDANGVEQIVAPETINRRGNEFVLGIGLRI